MEVPSDSGDQFDSSLIDLQDRSNAELRMMIEDLRREEEAVSYRRRVLHGRIDILRAELVTRLKSQHQAGEDLISGSEFDRLIDILSSDSRSLSGRYEPYPDDMDSDEQNPEVRKEG